MTIFTQYEDIDQNLWLQRQPQKEKIILSQQKPRIIVIAGPTGVGKTDLAISIAQILHGEVISADSMQVYRGMNIGTAKPSLEERQNIIHHLMDVKEITEDFNVVEFFQKAHQACRDIICKSKVPLLVGGSGFYIHTFLYGPPQGPASDKKVRQYLQEQMDLMGVEVLFERLQMLDPAYAATISPHDSHKIIRALEIIAITKRPVSSFPKPVKEKNRYYDTRDWFLYYPKEILFPRLDKRCDQMIANGFIEEVEQLEKQGLRDNPIASQAIGYKQCLEFLQSDRSAQEKEKFILNFKKATRKYVRRQFTWFRQEKDFRFINLAEISVDKAKEYILQDYEQGT